MRTFSAQLMLGMKFGPRVLKSNCHEGSQLAGKAGLTLTSLSSASG